MSTYEAVVGLLLAICSSDSTVQGSEGPTYVSSQIIIDTPCSTIYDRLKQLCSCINIYISKLRKPSTSDATQLHQEEGLDELLKTGQIVLGFMEKRKCFPRLDVML